MLPRIASICCQSYLNNIERIVFPCFLLLLFWAPLPLGSNRLWSSLLLFVISATLLAMLLFKYYCSSLPYTLQKGRWPLLLLFLVQSVVLFQIMPVFSGMADSISVYTIHMAPFQGMEAFFQGLSYLCAFALSLLLIASKHRLRWFIYTVALSAVFQAIYGMLNVLLDWDYLFVIKKEVMHNFVTGTFVNRNHLAGYLNIGLALGIGFMLSVFKKEFRDINNPKQGCRFFIELLFSRVLGTRMILLFVVIALIMTRSRAGNLAFIVSLISLPLFYYAHIKTFNIKLALFFISFLVLDAFLIGQWFGVGELVERVGQTNLGSESRMDLNIAILSAIKKYFWLGSGVNSFDVLLPIYMQSQAHVPFEHAHNDFLELFISLGFFGFIFLLAFITIIIRDNFLKKEPQYGIFMLITSVFILSIFDFNLYIPAFAYTVCASLATVYFSNKQGIIDEGQ